MKKIFILTLLLLVSACASSAPTKFYSISSENNEALALRDSRNSIVGVDLVVVPGYLDRPQIVTIKNSNELDLAEFDRWAEPLSGSLQRVIASNISSTMKKTVVKPVNNNKRNFDYIVSVEFNKLDGKLGENATLDAWWTIFNKEGKIVVSEHSSFITELDSSYDDLVAKQSYLVNKLSLEIAKKLSRI